MGLGHLLFEFSGRTNRGKYWLAWLIYAVIYLVFLALGFLTESTAVQMLTGMMVVAMFISSLAVGVKRLHDRNKPGWYVALFYAVPGALFFAGLLIGPSSAMVANALGFIALAIVIWAFVELGCLRGTIGVNSYGPDPVAPATLPPIKTPT
jgi:uncharacterized membrane protein YhaH (DUF805 family)